MDPRANWLLLANAALGNFLAGTASRFFSVSLPTVAASLETTIVGISWAVIAYQISQISLSLIFGRIGDIYSRHTLFGLGLVVSSIGALLCGLTGRRVAGNDRFCPAVLPAGCFTFEAVLHRTVIYQRTGFHRDAVAVRRLGCGQDGTAAAGHRWHHVPGRRCIPRILFEHQFALERSRRRVGFVGIGDGVIFHVESHRDDQLGAGATSRCSHRRRFM